MRSIRPLLHVLALLSVATSSAFASDGVREINQTCAVQTGCFDGDTAGFPVTITALGSYRLTSDLIVPDENTTAIEVQASDVGIDLNNFAIVRADCVGATTNCTSVTGLRSGVERQSPSIRGTSIKNGSIVGMGTYGALLGEQAEAMNLRVRWNRLDGINTSNGSTISGITAYQNGRYGISAGTASTVTGNTVFENGSVGIFAGGIATVTSNTAYLNGSDGISTGNGATISGNSTRDNGQDGIDGGNTCTIIDNAVYRNGDSTNSDSDDGIECSSSCLVRGNAVGNNRGFGLRLGTNSGYRENVLNSNTAGTVTGGVDAGANVINGVVTATP